MGTVHWIISYSLRAAGIWTDQVDKQRRASLTWPFELAPAAVLPRLAGLF